MELKKCESCQKVFFGDPSLRFCPICTVVQKGTQAIQRREAASQRHPLSAPVVAIAR